MPVADLVLDNPTKEFERYYIKVTDRSTNLVIYSASFDESPRLLREVGDLPGLYILQAEDSTVYVGQSKALGARLKTHRTSRKIGFNRILAVVRDQSLAQYLDYAEAKIYDELQKRGFRLEQAPLSGGLDTKRKRLSAQDNEHVRTADVQVVQFLTYAVALGLVKPVALGLMALSALDSGETPTPALAPTQHSPATLGTSAANVPRADFGSSERRGASRLRVEFPGSHLAPIQERSGAETLASAVYALKELVSDESTLLREGAKFKLSGDPLVGVSPCAKYPNAAKRRGKWFIATHSNTESKKSVLEQFCLALGVPVSVQIIQ